MTRRPGVIRPIPGAKWDDQSRNVWRVSGTDRDGRPVMVNYIAPSAGAAVSLAKNDMRDPKSATLIGS